MKRICVIFLCLFVCAASVFCIANELFYYAGNVKYPITVVANKQATLKPSITPKGNYVERIGNRIQIFNVNDGLVDTENPIIGEDKIGNISLPVLLINNQQEVVLLPEIIVQPKISNDIASVCQQHNLKLIKQTKNYQVYSVPIGDDVIGVANKLYETGEFNFSYPNFFCSAQVSSHIPDDEYFSYQIALHNTGQVINNGHTGTIDADIDAPEAWDISRGSSKIVVAVFDEGVTSDHPDLPNSRQMRLQRSNFGSGNLNDPSPSGNGNHGNACAGVIAATMDNSEGIAGIAPNCKIMPLRWDASSGPTDMADGIQFAVDSGANIISCSWGYKNSESSPNLHPVITSAINTAINSGVVVIFAAGNNGYVEFPANANINNLLTIGASDRYDQRAQYSPISSLIDFVAPSHRAYSFQISGETFEMWSIDIPGSAGYNPVNSEMTWELPLGMTLPNFGSNNLSYTGLFGGTSHSCPVVAGVVALMLSINPHLTVEEVIDILKETSDQVGLYTYVNGRCDQMGYGRVNAYKAVKEASNRFIQGPDFICDTMQYHLTHPSASNETISWSVHNGIMQYPNYSIIGPSNQDTITVVKTTLGPLASTTPEILGGENMTGLDFSLFPSDTIKYLSVTINDGDATNTYKKILRSPTGRIPTLSMTDSASLWRSGTSRTFTVSNCTNIPDSALYWTVEKIILYQHPTIHSDTTVDYYYGRSLTYTATTPKSTLCNLNISVTNLLKECEPRTITKNFIVTRSFFLNAIQEEGMLNVNIESLETSPRSQRRVLGDAECTLELWHTIYGCMKTQTVHATNEQISISGLPQGTYILLLKEKGEITAHTKIQIL